MRVSKIVNLFFIALVFALVSMPSIADARRSGGSSRSSSRSSRSSSSSSWGRSSRSNYYTGVVVIASPGGGYFSGYGNQCPFGCAMNGRCGTEIECKGSVVGNIIGWIFFALFCCCFCCIAAFGKRVPNKSGSYHSHHSHSSHSSRQ